MKRKHNKWEWFLNLGFSFWDLNVLTSTILENLLTRLPAHLAGVVIHVIHVQLIFVKDLDGQGQCRFWHECPSFSTLLNTTKFGCAEIGTRGSGHPYAGKFLDHKVLKSFLWKLAKNKVNLTKGREAGDLAVREHLIAWRTQPPTQSGTLTSCHKGQFILSVPFENPQRGE